MATWRVGWGGRSWDREQCRFDRNANEIVYAVYVEALTLEKKGKKGGRKGGADQARLLALALVPWMRYVSQVVTK